MKVYQNREKILGRIGRCIYCGTATEQLQDEHVVPFALNGEWKLLEASCQSCARITSGFERDVCRNMLIQARVALGLRTRHKKKKLPTTFPLKVIINEKPRIIDIPAEEHAVLMSFPIFALPAYLSHAPYERGIKIVDVEVTLKNQKVIDDLNQKYGRGKWRFGQEYQPTAFARMIAKIAYGFAVSQVGLNAFSLCHVLPSILGKSDDVGRWVGCEQTPPKNVGNFGHAVMIGGNGDELKVWVRLFTQFNVPEYVVMVGKLTEFGYKQAMEKTMLLNPESSRGTTT